jgi:SAM-dependent methyltransferase
MRFISRTCRINGKEVNVSHWRDDNALPATRARWQGVVNVVRFNWPLYAAGFTAASLAIAAALLVPRYPWLVAVLWAAGAAGVYFLLGSLLVSLWVYDLSPLYRFEWIPGVVAAGPRRILNLHSGFDESSAALRGRFINARLDVMDFYDAQTMTEPSIARARRYQERSRPAELAAITQSVSPDALPVEDDCIDAAFAILAAHEIRRPEDRVRFFSEIARVLRVGGRLIVVEHLRNPANFLAFGPQFTHFYSRAVWLDLARGAGFALVKESRITPFIGLFVFQKPGPASA